MKTKHSVLLFLAAMLLGGLLVWYFAAGPSVVELIPPTSFNDPNEPATATFENLRQKLSNHKLIVIGIAPQPELYQDLVSNFVAKLAEQNRKIVVLKEPKWGTLNINVQTADFDFNSDDISSSVQAIRDAVNAGQSVVIYTVSIFSTHLIEQNAIHRFEQAWGSKIPSITIGQLILHYEGENLNEPPCLGSMRDSEGLYPLGCAQLSNSRKHYKKRLPLDQKIFLLTEQEPLDYLLQIHFPAKNH